MYHVYILVDDNKKIYIGYSANLDRRISEHELSKVYTSSRMSNPRLYYSEAYISEDLAKEREKNLKRFGSSYFGLMKRIDLK